MELSGVPRSEELFYSLGRLNCHYYSFKYVFVPFSSPSGMPIMWRLVYFILSHKSLKLPSFSFFFSLVALIWWVSVPCVWVHWSFIFSHVVSCWNSLTYFSIQLLYSSAPEFLLVLFSIFSLLIFSFYLYVVFLSSVSIFMPVYYEIFIE